MVIALAFPFWRCEFQTCLRLQLMKSSGFTHCAWCSYQSWPWKVSDWLGRCVAGPCWVKSCGRETPPFVGISVPRYSCNQHVSAIFKNEQPKEDMTFCCCTSMQHCCGCWMSRQSLPLTGTFVPETPWSKIAEQDELSEQRKCTMEVLLRLPHHCESCWKINLITDTYICFTD